MDPSKRRGARRASEPSKSDNEVKGQEKLDEALWVFGVHAVEGCLRSGEDEIESLFLQEQSARSGLAKLAKSEGVLVRYRPRVFF
ncbi:MAG: RNA methyltransferase substrate-binding domain-containing protein, partial [Myxococcota bacterium]